MRTLKPKAPVTFARFFCDVADQLDGDAPDDVLLPEEVFHSLLTAARVEASDQQNAVDPEPDRKLHVMGDGCEVTTAVHSGIGPGGFEDLSIDLRTSKKHVVVKMPIAAAKLLVKRVSMHLVGIGEAFEIELPDSQDSVTAAQLKRLDAVYMNVGHELDRVGAFHGPIRDRARAVVDELLTLRECARAASRGEQPDSLTAPAAVLGVPVSALRQTIRACTDPAHPPGCVTTEPGEKFEPVPPPKKPRAKKKPADPPPPTGEQIDIETAAAQSEGEAQS